MCINRPYGFCSNRLPPCCSCQVEDLARVSFKKTPLYIGVDDSRNKVGAGRGGNHMRSFTGGWMGEKATQVFELMVR